MDDKTFELLEYIMSTFKTKLDLKPTWGRNQCFDMLNKIVLEELVERTGMLKKEIREKIPSIYELKSKNYKLGYATSITDKQKWRINQLEKQYSNIGLKFKGSSKAEAISFISKFINIKDIEKAKKEKDDYDNDYDIINRKVYKTDRIEKAMNRAVNNYWEEVEDEPPLPRGVL